MNEGFQCTDCIKLLTPSCMTNVSYQDVGKYKFEMKCSKKIAKEISTVKSVGQPSRVNSFDVF